MNNFGYVLVLYSQVSLKMDCYEQHRVPKGYNPLGTHEFCYLELGIVFSLKELKMHTNNKFEKNNIPKGPNSVEEIKELICEDLDINYVLDKQEMIIGDFRHSAGYFEALAKDTVKAKFGEYFSSFVPQSKSKNYGIKLLAGQKALSNFDIDTKELNIFFMGTGGSLHFYGKHKDVYEGGDVLCHLGMIKGIKYEKPTVLIRGVSTADFNSVIDYKNNPHLSSGGDIEEALLGSNIDIRLRIVMEQFFIPTLLQMTHKVLKNSVSQNVKPSAEFVFNIIGHSRGAITSYAMCDLIDKWMKVVTHTSPLRSLFHDKLDTLASNIAKMYLLAIESKQSNGEKYNSIEAPLSKDEIKKALYAIQKGEITFKTKLMGYDPVEGAASCGKSFTTEFPISIFGENLICDCAVIPSSVKEAQIFLALDERREVFQPTIAEVEDKKATSLKLTPVIGVHGTMKGYFSVFNDLGQYSYAYAEKDTFTKEVLRASADLIKIKSTTFLFDVLPPFDKITFYNLFYSNEGEGYISTRAHFLDLINQLLNKPTENFSKFLKDLEVTSDNFINNPTHINLIKVCEWIMKNDLKSTRQLYFDLEKDIYDIYLCPKEPSKALKLKSLRKEMRSDTMSAINNQNIDESRHIWFSAKKSGDPKQIMLARHHEHLSYDPMSTILYQKSKNNGRNDDLYYEDPFYFNLFDVFTDSELKKFSSEEIKSLRLLSYDFADLNEKGAILMTNLNNSKAKVDYHQAKEKLSQNLNEATIDIELKIKIRSILMMKEQFQYHILSDFKEDPDYTKLLMASLNYQLKETITLIEIGQHHDDPRLYRAIHKLILRIKECEVIEYHDWKILEDCLEFHGKEIIKNDLISELTSWQNVVDKFQKEKTVLLKNDSSGIEIRKEIQSLIGVFDELNHLKNECNHLTGSAIEQITHLDKIKYTMNELIQNQINNLGTPVKILKSPHGRTVKHSGLANDLQDSLFRHERDLYQKQMKITSKSNKKVGLEKDTPVIADEDVNSIYVELHKIDPRFFSFSKKDSILESEIVKSFLQSVNEKNVEKMMAYLEAAKKLWKAKWFDLTSRSCDSLGNTPLHLIAISGEIELWNVVKIFETSNNISCEVVFDFTTKNNEGLTPLEAAIKEGNVDIVRGISCIHNRMNPTMYSLAQCKFYITQAKINRCEINEKDDAVTKSLKF